MSFYFDVALNLPLNETFIYRGSKEMFSDTDLESYFGRRVSVPFGNRKLTGFIVGIHKSLPESIKIPESKIREIIKIQDQESLLTKELYDLAKWISNYYLCSIGESIFAMIPSGKRETDIPGFSFSQDETSFEKKQRTLSKEQIDAVNGILKPTEESNLFHYLYGKTGTGKTEVFLSSAEKVLQEGKGVIYLVPEIGLTPQVADAVTKRFGNTAAVLHSGLTPSQRLTEWKRILHREARVIIGARSAIFAPVPDLGLIIIDEEHDSSYKAGSSPRYHGRQVAMHRATVNKIPLVMGSATPSVEAYYLMEQKVLEKHILTQRLAGGAMPEIKAVNLSLDKPQGCLSSELIFQMKKTLEEKKQIILFLNRRGFTHFFRCNSCGFEMKCKNCSVSMTFHKKEKRLRCHYCGYNTEVPSQCPECGSLDVGYSGFGTEFIEAEVQSKFPNEKILRIDTDNISKEYPLQERLEDFKNGKYSILLGTQMVAKGLNFPNLSLVGVVLADTSLHLPDFRASEKTFSLITQVAGRAGRFFPDGKVLVQSYSPDREAIDCSVNSRDKEFYEKEIQTRAMLGFPPFTRLLRLVFRSQFKNHAEKAASDSFKILNDMKAEGVQILGPSECPLAMISNNHRIQILLRAKKLATLQKMAKVLLQVYKVPSHVYIETDVDPQNLL